MEIMVTRGMESMARHTRTKPTGYGCGGVTAIVEE